MIPGVPGSSLHQGVHEQWGTPPQGTGGVKNPETRHTSNERGVMERITHYCGEKIIPTRGVNKRKGRVRIMKEE